MRPRRKYKSDPLRSVHLTMEALYLQGLVAVSKMVECDEACLHPPLPERRPVPRRGTGLRHDEDRGLEPGQSMADVIKEDRSWG